MNFQDQMSVWFISKKCQKPVPVRANLGSPRHCGPRGGRLYVILYYTNNETNAPRPRWAVKKVNCCSKWALRHILPQVLRGKSHEIKEFLTQSIRFITNASRLFIILNYLQEDLLKYIQSNHNFITASLLLWPFDLTYAGYSEHCWKWALRHTVFCHRW